MMKRKLVIGHNQHADGPRVCEDDVFQINHHVGVVVLDGPVDGFYKFRFGRKIQTAFQSEDEGFGDVVFGDRHRESMVHVRIIIIQSKKCACEKCQYFQ